MAGQTYSAVIVDALTRFGDRTAFIQDDISTTFAETAALTSRLQQVLEAKGITKGSCLGTLSVSTPELWMVQAAGCLTGAMYTGLHPLGSVDDHVDLCDDSGISVLVVHPLFAERAAQIAARATTVKHVLTLGPASEGEDLLELCREVGPTTLSAGIAEPEDIAWLQYTGGTTGRPKGAMISHRAMVQEVLSLTCSWRLPLDPRTLIATPITQRGCAAGAADPAARGDRRPADVVQARRLA
jgi:fatty-acyl-CoA synthase